MIDPQSSVLNPQSSALSADVLDLVAHPGQGCRNALAMVALNLQLAVLERAAGPTLLLETTLEEAQRRIPPGSALLEQAEGGVLLRIHSDRLDWLACMLLTLECPFVVRRPPELREALRQIATRAAALAERSA